MASAWPNSVSTRVPQGHDLRPVAGSRAHGQPPRLCGCRGGGPAGRRTGRSDLGLPGDHAWDFDELAATIGTLIGSDVTFRNLTPAAHADMLTGFGLDAGLVGFVVGLDTDIRDGLLGETTGDLACLTGKPPTPLAAGLARAS